VNKIFKTANRTPQTENRKMKKLTFIILCLEGAILSFNVAACAALVPSIARDFGISQFVAGKVIWLYMLPYGVAALFYGPLVRMVDAKRVELICLLVFSLANLLAWVSPDIKSLFLARFIMGVFGASVIPLGLILIANSAQNQKRGKLVGSFFGSTFIASLLGLFLSGILHWRMVFFIPAILGFVLWLMMYFYLPNFKSQRTETKFNYMAALKDKRIISIFAYIFFISLLYHSIQQWLGVYFSTKFALGQFLISALITLTSLSGIFGEVIGGWLSDAVGRIKTVNLGTVLMIISVLLFSFKSPIAILAILMVIWGLGWTFNHAGISTVLTDLPKDFLPEAASLNSSVRFISGGLGTALSGSIMQKSFTAGFVLAGLCLLGLFLFARQLIIKI
jgi:predicted MFS family arabinose efflux permease